ncbi:hypothetical protein QU38_00855, partial [Staphylococcus aureus]
PGEPGSDRVRGSPRHRSRAGDQLLGPCAAGVHGRGQPAGSAWRGAVAQARPAIGDGARAGI